jgi:hypothetical protein
LFYNLKSSYTTAILKNHKEEPMAKVGIGAFAFGMGPELPANQTIRRLSKEASAECDSPIFSQLDVFFKTEDGVSLIKEKPGKPPTTLQMARAMVKWAEERELSGLIIVVAPMHIQRSLRDIRAAIKERDLKISARVWPAIDYLSRDLDIWFSLKSKQARTRSISHWRKREAILMSLPFWLYRGADYAYRLCR